MAGTSKKVGTRKATGTKRAASKKAGASGGRAKKAVARKKTVKGSAGVKRRKAASKTKASTTQRAGKKAASKKRGVKKSTLKTASTKQVKKKGRVKKKGVKKSVKKLAQKKAARKATTKKGARSSRVLTGKKTAAKKPGSKKTGNAAAGNRKRPVGIFARTNARSATSQDPIQFPEESRKMPKTHLSRKELKEFRELLLQKRRELAGDVRHMSRSSTSMSAGFGEKPAMPMHMADVGTDNWEHEFTLGLIENEQGRIRQIDESLKRIAQRTYGVCLATFKPISRARLRAKPWAKYCIEYARAREEGRVR
ncbi:MAG: hypothetical protein ACE5E5_04115 [Phycisphaerae bacterium]